MAGPGCILSRFLEEQYIVSTRMARAANLDTPEGGEWRKVVEALFALRADHVARCERCRPVPNGVVKP